jgi:hypothetical protein
MNIDEILSTFVEKTFFLTKQLSIACYFQLDSNYEFFILFY